MNTVDYTISRQLYNQNISELFSAFLGLETVWRVMYGEKLQLLSSHGVKRTMTRHEEVFAEGITPLPNMLDQVSVLQQGHASPAKLKISDGAAPLEDEWIQTDKASIEFRDEGFGWTMRIASNCSVYIAYSPILCKRKLVKYPTLIWTHSFMPFKAEPPAPS